MGGVPKEVATTCPYCGVGCGVRAAVGADGETKVAGDRRHPANFGRLCVKGAALAETLAPDNRLLHPQIDGERATWSAALDLVAGKFGRTIAAHGPDSVAFYVSGQILTEDYYVANKLTKGFVGSANIDTNSRLCMSASVAGHKRAFGSDTAPGVYEDLEQADLVVLVGSNLAWCHPVLFQRISAAREKRGGLPAVVNIDPRRTATSEIADLHLALAPGTDVALFLGLLCRLDRDGRGDPNFVSDHVKGADEALLVARKWSEAAVAEKTGLLRAEIERFYDLFSRTQKVVTVYSQGVNQSSAGADKVNAIVNCHLFTGRIGRVGMGPFSVTGQPNAMGGREVGGLANQLAAHLEIENPRHRQIVQAFWESPEMPDRAGLKAVDLFRAVGSGAVKAIWIMGTNPVDSLPDADAVRAALAACPFVVVSDVVERTDTNRYAHVLLPAQAWGEKDGTVTNSERRISRQRAFRSAPGEAMPDWWALCGVARRLGHGRAFDYSGPAAIFREHAALSGFRNAGTRAFDISALADVSDADYQALAPFQWPWRAGEPHSDAPKRFFAEGGFFTPDRRARMIATPFKGLASQRSARRPFVLNTGRIRDQWHTMTRTGVSPRLSQHLPEPFVEIHPDDAARLGATANGLVRLFNARGEMIARAHISESQQRGSVFAPLHWTDRFASRARVNALVAPNLDPVAGQPESKGSVVAVEALTPAWFGFALMRKRPELPTDLYWALARIEHGYRVELAGFEGVGDWPAWAATLFGIDAAAAAGDLVTMSDRQTGVFRCVAREGDAVVGALYVSHEPVEIARAWVCETFSAGARDPIRLLVGRPARATKDAGDRICACNNVGANAIVDAVARGCRDLRAVGEATGAGAGCGSCRPEIERIVKAHARGEGSAAQPERAAAPAL
jgi:assimilatory nitrate reductase catalytic subunit